MTIIEKSDEFVVDITPSIELTDISTYFIFGLLSMKLYKYFVLHKASTL